jgi:hypothetical protein
MWRGGRDEQVDVLAASGQLPNGKAEWWRAEFPNVIFSSFAEGLLESGCGQNGEGRRNLCTARI